MTVRERWKKSSLPNQLLVIVGLMAAFFTGLYAVATVVQICLMKAAAADATRQTERLIQEASRIAWSMQEAIRQNQQAIDNAAVANRKAIEASERQNQAIVKSSIAQSKAALDASIEASRNDQRAWLTVDRFRMSEEPAPDRGITVTLWIKNSGKTPGLDAVPYSKPSAWLITQDPPIITDEESRTVPVHSVGMIPPGSVDTRFTTDPFPLNAVRVQAYQSQQTKRRLSFE